MTDKDVFKQLLDKPEYQQKLLNVSGKIPKDYIKRIQKLLNASITKIKTEGYEYPSCYRNNKTVIKEVSLTRHSINQFKKRFKKVYEGNVEDLPEEKWCQLLCYMINSSSKENLHKKHLLQYRKERYENLAMYISYGCFRFVIVNAVLVTSELKGYYYELN